MTYTTFMIIVILSQTIIIHICTSIDLNNRQNTNRLLYIIGYIVGCIVTFIGYQLNIFK